MLPDSKQIEKFCKTQNRNDFAKLRKSSQIAFKRFAQTALRFPNTNHSIAKKVIAFSTFQPQYVPDKKTARELIKTLPISCTGARKGDILIGLSKEFKGTRIKTLADIAPCSEDLNHIRAFPDLWEQFIAKLSSTIRFFSKMSSLEVDIWLEINEDTFDTVSSTAKFVLIERYDDTDPESKDNLFQYVHEFDVSSLIGGFDAEQISTDLAHIKLHSNPKSLPFKVFHLKSMWKIDTTYQIPDGFTGLVIDIQKNEIFSAVGRNISIFELYISNGSIAESYKKTKKGYEITSHQSVGFIRYEGNFPYVPSSVPNVFSERYMKDLPQKAFASLLDSIIQFTPTYVTFSDEKIPAKVVLMWIFDSLINMEEPKFDSSLQGYFNGMQVLARQIALSAYRNSSLPLERLQDLLSLLGGVLAVQANRKWIPHFDTVYEWIGTMFNAYETMKVYNTNYKSAMTKRPYILSTGNTVLQNASALLDAIGGSEKDLAIARGWAEQINVEEGNLRPREMPYYNCINHEWAPMFAYFFNYKIAKKTEKYQKVLSKPFEPLFETMSKVIGANPRRAQDGYSADFDKRTIVRACKNAQQLYLVSLQYKQTTRKSVGQYKFKYIIPHEWLAGLIGPVTVKSKGKTIIVTLRVEDPTQFVATRTYRSTKKTDGKYVPLTREEENDAIKIMVKRLKNKGILLDHDVLPDESFRNAKIKLKDGNKYYLTYPKSKKAVPWDQCRTITVHLPVYNDIPRDLYTCLTQVGTGVENNFMDKIVNLLKGYHQDVVNRLLIYLNNFSTISMSRVNREGGTNGTMSLSIDDIAVYHVLLKISTIAPAAVRPEQGSPGKFTIFNMFLLKQVRDRIVQMFRFEQDSKGWTSRFADLKREPRDYQRVALEDMIISHNQGIRGSFLWLPLGSGKTFLVLSYLKWLKDNDELPKYVLYTLPPEAVVSIIQEIEYFDIPINVMIPLKNISAKTKQFKSKKIEISQSCEMKPYHINVIYHDYLKNCRDMLSVNAKNSVVVFDEVHLLLNQSLRTNAAMELASLCKEFVALTGTPIVDNRTAKLVSWLKRIVPFEVNTKNFWVAANNMIAKDTTVKLETKTEHKLASFTPVEQKEYMSLVPPALGGTNKSRKYNWRRAADICYDACDRTMVELTRQYVKEGRGVMLVVRDNKHQERMYREIIKYIQPVFLIKKDQTIFLTDETVASGETPDYKVVIVPQNRSQGYTLTRLNVMITSVYPSNSATRDQLRGRINRIGQKVQPLLYDIVHVGLLTKILKEHQSATNLVKALEAIANQ